MWNMNWLRKTLRAWTGIQGMQIKFPVSATNFLCGLEQTALLALCFSFWHVHGVQLISPLSCPFLSLEMSFKEKSADLLLMSTNTEVNTQCRIHLCFEYCRRRTRKAIIEYSRLTFRKFLTPSQISCVIFTKSFNLSLIQLCNHEGM